MDVSIIVPVFNSEKYLDECITSLLKQHTNYRYEIIAVDDGSQDHSMDILKKYEDRIKIYETTGSAPGPSDARNLGISHAKGKYLMFVDSDDYVTTTFVENMMHAIFKTGADIVICDYYDVSDKITHVKKGDFAIYPKGEIQDVLRMEFHSCNKIFARNLISRHPYPSGMFFEDVVTVALAELDANLIVKIPDALYYYRNVKDSTTRTLKDTNYDILKATDMIEPAFLKHGYKDEIEYLYVNQVLVDLCIKIVKSNVENYKEKIEKLRSHVLKKYPNCFSNPYLKKERLMKRAYLFSLKHRLYFIIAMAFRRS